MGLPPTINLPTQDIALIEYWKQDLAKGIELCGLTAIESDVFYLISIITKLQAALELAVEQRNDLGLCASGLVAINRNATWMRLNKDIQAILNGDVK